MSVYDTREIGKVKICMLKGQDGAGAYTAGDGIDLTNNVISNTMPGYACNGAGKMTSYTSNVVDTDIDLHRAPVIGDRILLYCNSAVSNPSSIKTYNNGTAISNATGPFSPINYVRGFNVLEFRSNAPLPNCWALVQAVETGLPENPLATSHGGTGNADGYIRTGAASGSTIGSYATIEGAGNTASNDYAHAEGYQNTASGSSSHAEGWANTASGSNSHTEGESNTASGEAAHAEGISNTASGDYSHAEGSSNIASEEYAHAEGSDTEASGVRSHAEGWSTTASGEGAHAEGSSTTASGDYAHAEGYNTVASYQYAHAEGANTEACEYAAHAGGTGSIASEVNSFAHGRYVNAGVADLAAFGKFNNCKSGDIFEIGNGTSVENRSNALEVKSNGDLTASGTITDGEGHTLSTLGDIGLSAANGMLCMTYNN